MADIEDKEASGTTRIVGDDEQFAADVVDENGDKKLLVRSSSNLSSDLVITQTFDLNQVMSNITFTDIYNESGIKTISGFWIQFNDKRVEVELIVDGNTIFNINCEKLKDVSDWNQAFQPQTYVSWNDGKKVFYFTPNFPLQSTTSVQIKVKSLPGQSKKLEGYLLQVG